MQGNFQSLVVKSTQGYTHSFLDPDMRFYYMKYSQIQWVLYMYSNVHGMNHPKSHNCHQSNHPYIHKLLQHASRFPHISNSHHRWDQYNLRRIDDGTDQ